MKPNNPTIKFREISLTSNSYTASEVVELIKIVESSIREGYYININIAKQSTLQVKR